jgi:hypothetical protein
VSGTPCSWRIGRISRTTTDREEGIGRRIGETAHEEFKAEDVMVGDSSHSFGVVSDTCKYLEPKAGGEAFRGPLLKLHFWRVLSLGAYAYHQEGYLQKVFLKVLKALTGEAFVRGSCQRNLIFWELNGNVESAFHDFGADSIRVVEKCCIHIHGFVVSGGWGRHDNGWIDMFDIEITEMILILWDV